MNQLFTIGYEGAALEDFLGRLVRHRIQVLVDVRELAGSRRPGFSKSALSAALSAAGIEYRHERALGSPRDIRHKLRADGNLQAFFRSFDAYLRTQTNVLEQLAETCMGNVALMCFERDYTTCHRFSVARELGRLADLVPVHMTVEHGPVRQTPRVHPRQGLPAA